MQAFAARHGIRAGIQVSPLALHSCLQRALDQRNWLTQWPTLVLAGPRGHHDQLADPPGLEVVDHASPPWLEAWSRCEPGRDVAAHARTVFALLRGRAIFARLDQHAVAIAVEDDGLLGLFCVAVDPDRRRSGLARQLMRALLARSRADQAYLQVEESNAAAIALYTGLGFSEAYRYCHRWEHRPA